MARGIIHHNLIHVFVSSGLTLRHGLWNSSNKSALVFCISCAACRSVFSGALRSRHCSVLALLKSTNSAPSSNAKHSSGVLVYLSQQGQRSEGRTRNG